jgi:hypothetical protein
MHGWGLITPSHAFSDFSVISVGSLSFSSYMVSEDPHDQERSDRLSLGFIDSGIIACLDREPFHSKCSIAEAIDISSSMVFRHLRDSLGMEIFIFVNNVSQCGRRCLQC